MNTNFSERFLLDIIARSAPSQASSAVVSDERTAGPHPAPSRRAAGHVSRSPNSRAAWAAAIRCHHSTWCAAHSTFSLVFFFVGFLFVATRKQIALYAVLTLVRIPYFSGVAAGQQFLMEVPAPPPEVASAPAVPMGLPIQMEATRNSARR